MRGLDGEMVTIILEGRDAEGMHATPTTFLEHAEFVVRLKDASDLIDEITNADEGRVGRRRGGLTEL
jgi:hypothetical protein